MQVKLKMVRLAFPKLWKAEAVGNGDGKYYSAAFPIEPGSENHKALEAAIEAACKEKFGAKWQTALAKIREEKRCSYQHKASSNSDGDVYDGFEGMYTLNASRPEKKGRPSIFDSKIDPDTGKVRVIESESEGRPYGGCYVNATVDIWVQDNSFGRRVNAQLLGVQFAKDGDAFTGGAKASPDDFDAVEGAEAEDLG